MEHVGLRNEVRSGGIVHVCSCGWESRECFTSMVASCEGIDHREREERKVSDGERDAEERFNADPDRHR